MSTPWLDVATRLMGTKEAPGSSNNPVIISWAKKLGGWIANYFKGDDIPWCGLFVAHCYAECGYKGPANPLSALAWKDWGVSAPAIEGALLVFKRPGGGHVGFYVGENDTAYRVRGGNQADSVSDTWISKDRLVGIRWPEGVTISGRPIRLNNSGKLSTNEA